MVRIAYILTPIEFGGSERVNATFLQNVNRDRFDIDLILLIRPWEEGNIFIDLIAEYNYKIITIPVAKHNPIEGRDYFRVARCMLKLYLILLEGSYDIVHSHGYFADIISCISCKILNIKHISTCHGFIANSNSLIFYNTLDKWVLRYCEKVIAVSSGIKDELVDNGVKVSRLTVIQNAVNCPSDLGNKSTIRTKIRKLLSLNEDAFLIGFVGRLSKEKGASILIEAASILRQTSKSFKVVIVGEGPQKDYLIALSNSKGLNKNVIFTGFQHDVDKWLSAFDVFVLPSLTEGTPLALLESMSHSVPAVASAVGGVPFVIDDGVSGLLVEPGNPIMLSEKIERLQCDPTFRKQLGNAALNTIKEKFDVEVWCRSIESEYYSLLAKKV